MEGIEKQLERIGLDKKEALTYSTLFTLGKATAQELAKKLQLPRTTVYGYLKLLIEKNLISEEKVGAVTHFVMNSPASLERWIEVQKELLAEKADAASHLSKALMPGFTSHSTRTPQVIVAKGKREVERLLYRYAPQWNQSYKNISEPVMWGYQDHTFVEEYYRWHKGVWHDEPVKKSICLFSNLDGVRQQKRDKIPNRTIKLLPSSADFASSIWIHGEYVLLGNTRSDPHTAVLVYEPMLAENLRTVFKLLWRLIP